MKLIILCLMWHSPIDCYAQSPIHPEQQEEKGNTSNKHLKNEREENDLVDRMVQEEIDHLINFPLHTDWIELEINLGGSF